MTFLYSYTTQLARKRLFLYTYHLFQARAKLPKKRRRVLPVEPTRGPRIPGQTSNNPGAQGAGTPVSCPGGPPTGAPNRRMNAVKSNFPKDALGSVPKIGKDILCKLIKVTVKTG